MQKPSPSRTGPGFIESLERYVKGDGAQSMPSQFSIVEQLLREIAQYPEQLAKRTETIVTDDAYEPHTDCPCLFQAQNGAPVERVHSHKGHASTIIMRGQYAEKRFAVHDLNDKEMKAKITQAAPLVLWEGETNSLLMGVPHQITTQRGSSIPSGMPSRMPTGLKNKRSWDPVI